MERPRIKLQMDSYDWIISIIGIVFIILLFAYPAYYYSQLPDRLPSHFSISGEPDRYNAKEGIWILPVVATSVFALLSLFISKPHWANYRITITKHNAKRQYWLSSKLCRTIRMIIAILFFYLLFSKVNIGLGNREALNPWFLPFFLLSIFGTVSIYFYLAYGKK